MPHSIDFISAVTGACLLFEKLCLDDPNSSLIPRTFLGNHVFVASGTAFTNNFCPIASRQRGFQIYTSWWLGEACKKPLAKAQIWNTLCIQDTNWFFCLRERLTKETDFVRVRLSPYGFILEFRPSSHFRTVYFTKWPARSAGCQILCHPQFFSCQQYAN